MNELKKELQNCKTMAEFLAVCSKYYDFENAKLGTLSKAALIQNIHLVINLSGAKPKK